MESRKAPNNIVITINGNRATIYRISYDRDSLIDILSKMTKKYVKKGKCKESKVRMNAIPKFGTRILTEHGLVVSYTKERLEPMSIVSSVTGKPYHMPLANIEYSVYEYPELAKAVLAFMQNPCQLEMLDQKILKVLELNATVYPDEADGVEFIPGIVSAIRKDVCVECPVDDLDGYLRGMTYGNHLEVSKETRKIRNGQTNSEGIINSIPPAATPIKPKVLKRLFNPRVSRSLGI